MAGILGVIDLQQIRQNLGLAGNVHIPSSAEIDKIRREKFGAPPLPQTVLPDPSAMDNAITQAKQGKTVTSLFYRKEGYSVGDLTFDLILDEDHAFSSTVSTHPVESGADITDHIQKQLQMGSLKGLISNHSINNRGINRTNVREANSLGAGRAGAAWQVCRWIYENQEPVTVVTCLDTYPDVAIKDMKTRRDAETGDALVIEVTFQQMRRVSLKILKAQAVVAPKDMKTSINRQTAVTQSQGKVVGSEVVMDLGETRITGVVR